MTNFEVEAMNRAGKRMADDIDWGVTANIYRAEGWTEVIVPALVTSGRYLMMKSWCEEQNIAHHSRWDTWLFRNEQDSVAFILRWL